MTTTSPTCSLHRGRLVVRAAILSWTGLALGALWMGACSNSSGGTPNFLCQKDTTYGGCECASGSAFANSSNLISDCSTSAFPGTTCCAGSGWPPTNPNSNVACFCSPTMPCSPSETLASCSAPTSSGSSSGGASNACTYDFYTHCQSASECPGSFQCAQTSPSNSYKLCTVACSNSGDCSAPFAACANGSPVPWSCDMATGYCQ